MPTNLSLTSGRRWLIIAVLAFTAFAPTLRLGFLWDDHVMIENNPHIQSWSWANVRHDFTSDAFEGQGNPYYRPAQLFLNRLDYTFWGLRPFGYHLTNLAAHTLNALLIDMLVVALGFSPLVALLCATLFAVHPIGVEQLMIIAGRAELLGLTCTLWTLLAMLKDDDYTWLWGCLAYGLGLLFKESCIVIPILAILAFYLKAVPSRRYARLLPLLLLTVPYLFLRKAAVGPAWPAVPFSLVSFFFIKAFASVLIRYIGLILIPWNLHSHRLMPHLSHAWPSLLGAWVAAAIYGLWNHKRTWVFCLGWFVICFLPKTPGMFAGNFMLDHWAYPALLGVLLPLALFFNAQWTRHHEPLHGALATGYFLLLIIWALLAQLNIALRGTDEKMYRWALHFTTSHPVEYNLGILLLQTGRPGEAIGFLEDYYQAYPDDSKNTNALAQAYWKVGDSHRALVLLTRQLRYTPYDPLTLQDLRAMAVRPIPRHPKNP